MKLNRNKLRHMIKESLNELTLINSGAPKVVDMQVKYSTDETGQQGAPAFIFRHEELPGGIMRAGIYQAGEALNSLVQMGFTQINISGPLSYDTIIDDETQIPKSGHPFVKEPIMGPNDTPFYDYRD